MSPTTTEQEPYIRLLVCRTCKTIEELPPFDGRPEDDVLLTISVERHGESHTGLLYNVSALHWQSETMRDAIKKQIAEGSPGLDIFGTQFYETKMTFHEDAMKCFALHMRPKGQCPDYMSNRKRLSPGTKHERKELGLDPTTGPKVYLCQFCPVHTYNMTKKREQAGLYE